MLKRWRTRWLARRRDLAFRQIEADRAIPEPDSPGTDAFTGEFYESRRALGGLLNPKAKTQTEWRGD